MQNFSQVLVEAYQQRPDQAAIHLIESGRADRTLRYRDLLHGAAGYLQTYLEQGILPGEVVVLVVGHGSDLIYAYWGAVLAGAVPAIMPFLTEKLSPQKYRQSLEALFRITQPAAVVTDAAFRSEIQRAAGDSSALKALLVASEIHPAAELQVTTLPGLTRQAADIALLQHSSGTTGLQKGVALSHQAVFNQIESYHRALRLTKSDVIASWLPLYHDMGLIAGFILPLLSGTPLVLMSPFDWVRAPYKFLQAVSRYQATLCWQPNFAYNFCAQKIRDRDLAEVDLSRLRALINCSEPMYWDSHQVFLERFAPYGFRPSALATSYAMAENVFAVTQGGIEAPVATDTIDRYSLQTSQVAVAANDNHHALKMLSAGQPIDNTRLRVIDNAGQALPERTVGEIALQSNCMLTGYYNRPDLTRQAFLDGWYLTGDLGYLAEGELYITGRKKDLIIVGGKNIYPQDIEYLVNDIPGVHPGRAVAFGVYNPQTGTEDVVVVAETDLAEAAQHTTIADDVRQRVTRDSDVALRNVHIVPRDWLIKTSSGKIARAANREKYLQEIAH